MPDRCYCQTDLGPGARQINVNLDIDWGAADERDDWKGTKTFCSFSCLASWAQDQAAKWDPAGSA